MRDAEGKRCIGADVDLDMPVGPFRGLGAPRVDDDDLHAFLFRFLDARPHVDVDCHQVGTPRHDEVRIGHRLRVGAADRAHGEFPCRFAAGVADRARLQAARAQRMEEAVGQAAIDQALVGAVGVAEEGGRARFGNDALPTGSDLVERLVPADRHELAFALRARAAQRGRKAARRMHQFRVAHDLSTGKARGKGLLGVAFDLRDASLLHRGDQRAHVGAVMPANDANRIHAAPLLLEWGLGYPDGATTQGEVCVAGCPTYNGPLCRNP